MKKGIRQIRLCKCNCGKEVQQRFSKDGRFKGYSTIAKGCSRHTEESKEKIRKSSTGMNNPRSKPLFTRRIHHEHGKSYWQIKVSESGRWKYEHRYIMEQFIGKTLSNKEHVHHINNDGLDNRIENLIVLSHSEHSKIDAFKKLHSWDKTKPHACPLCKKIHCGD